jgi:glutamine---fructose-6-phosphate transaminase (isomerizing)
MEASVLSEFSLLEGEYLSDILDQPRALQDTLDSFENSSSVSQLTELSTQKHLKSVVLTGMGASFHALHPLHLGLTEHGLQSVMVETSELIHYQRRLFDSKNLIVAVSQSGQSAETVRLLELNRRRSPIIAITNTPGSPLAEQATATILTQAGKEFSVSCKTYVATLLALQWLEDIACERDLGRTREEFRQAIPVVKGYLANWKNHVQNLAESLRSIRHLFLVGRGRSLTAVGTGALIIKESDHFHAEGMSSAAFRHGPFEMLCAETFVLVFAGDEKTRDLNQKLLDDIRKQHGRAELVSENAAFPPCALPAVPSCVQPILEILPVQMITLALAAQACREPGRFQLASKVTTIE